MIQYSGADCHIEFIRAVSGPPIEGTFRGVRALEGTTSFDGKAPPTRFISGDISSFCSLSDSIRPVFMLNPTDNTPKY
jgi:hypothetical protein